MAMTGMGGGVVGGGGGAGRTVVGGSVTPVGNVGVTDVGDTAVT